MSSDVVRRAELHAALGDPTRLTIVDELVGSDRAVSDLRTTVGIPGNLLAHHLDVLEGVGLVERLVSSGDRRRRYVALRASAVEELGLRTELPRPRRVLFVCTHNSARSQLAAAAWRREFGGRVRSAGTRPAARVHPGAVAAARRAGLDLTDERPRPLRSTSLDVDLVVTVCDRAHEELAPRSGWRHWSIPDPVAAGGKSAFDEVMRRIDDHLRILQDLTSQNRTMEWQ